MSRRLNRTAGFRPLLTSPLCARVVKIIAEGDDRSRTVKPGAPRPRAEQLISFSLEASDGQ
jgi:hypothetical protein